MAHFFVQPGFMLARADQIGAALYATYAPVATIAQSEFLLLLDRLGPMPQIQLSQAAGYDKSTTGYVLDNLQAAGWIGRSPCEADRRRMLVSLAHGRRSEIETIRAHYARLQQDLAAPLAKEDAEKLIGMLYELAANPLSPAPRWISACDPAQGVLDHALSFLIRRALQHVQAQLMAVAPEPRFTLRQFSLLFIVKLRGSITQTAFARMFGLDPSTCAVILRGHVSRGLLAGRRSPEDGREFVYAITETGVAAMEKYRKIADRAQRLAFRGHSAGDVRWLVGQLRVIAKAYSSQLRFPGLLEAS